MYSSRQRWFNPADASEWRRYAQLQAEAAHAAAGAQARVGAAVEVPPAIWLAGRHGLRARLVNVGACVRNALRVMSV